MLKFERISSMPTVAVYNDSAFSGIEIKKVVDYGPDTYVMCISDYGQKRAHRVKVHVTERPYFVLFGRRIYLHDCMRVDV